MGIKFDVVFESSVFHYPRPRKSRDIFLTSDWSSGSAREETLGNTPGKYVAVLSPKSHTPARTAASLDVIFPLRSSHGSQHGSPQAIPQGNLHRVRPAHTHALASVREAQI